MKFAAFLCILALWTGMTEVYARYKADMKVREIVAGCKKTNTMEAPGYPNGYPCGRSTYDKKD